MPKQSTPFPWIKGPYFDLSFFGFIYVPLLLVFVAVNQSAWRISGRWWLISFVLLISCFHRHITFPLVYGDKEKFAQRPKSYLLLPVFFLALTAFCILYKSPAEYRSPPLAVPLQLSPQDQINFSFYHQGKVQSLPVKLTGTESTVGEVAAAITQQTNGIIVAQAESTPPRLHLELEATDGSFRVVRFTGSPNLGQTLGLESLKIKSARSDRSLFAMLAIAAGIWCLYHALMQKFGILRIYSRKASEGSKWLDKGMIFAWATFTLCLLGALPSIHKEIARVSGLGGFFRDVLKTAGEVFPYLAALSGAAAIAITFLYVKKELSRDHHFLWSKNLYMISIMGLFPVFFYDPVVGYVLFGFSHAVEYLAFVNVFSKKSYQQRPAGSSWMARWVRHQGWAFATFLAASVAIFVPWYFYSRHTLNWYIVGSSFLHFIYDGWIWKVRDPAVGKPLGIAYPSQTTAPLASAG